MDGRQLAVFAAVARTNSFTRASIEIHLAQSAVSATIAALETDLGERLFVRSTRKVQLTDAGRALVPHATRVLDSLQAARDAVEGVRGGISGSLRIGYMTNVTLFDIPGLLGRFSNEFPAVGIHLTPSATGTAGLARELRRGELDLAFLAGGPIDHPGLQIEVLATAPVGLAVRASSPIAALTTMTLAETAAMRFIDFRPGFGNRTLTDKEFDRMQLRREVLVETADLIDAAALVRNGLGVAFLPQYLVEDDPLIRWIKISDANLELNVSLGTSRDRPLSAAATRLATQVRKEAASAHRPARSDTSIGPHQSS
jgi:DNA-binding transcriptional LysR family regulator